MEPLAAGVVFVLCVLALTRLLLGASRRRRVDSALQRAWFRLRVQAVTLWRWRRIRREAHHAARDAIARASGKAGGTGRSGAASDGEWKGNVY